MAIRKNIKRFIKLSAFILLFFFVLMTSLGFYLYSDLKNHLNTYVPEEIKKELHFQKLSYDAYKNYFFAENLTIKDENVSIKVERISFYFYWLDYLLHGQRIELFYLDISKPKITVNNIRNTNKFKEKWNRIKKYLSSLNSTKGSKRVFQTGKAVFINGIKLKKAVLKIRDYPYKKNKKKIVHIIKDITIRIKKYKLTQGLLEDFVLSATLYGGAKVKIEAEGSLKQGKCKINLNPGLFLNKYNIYLSSGSYYIKSGSLIVKSFFDWKGNILSYKNNVLIKDLSVKKNVVNPLSFFESIVASPFMEMLKDGNGNIAVKVKGVVTLKKGWEYALTVVRKKTVKSLEKKLSF